MRERHERSVWDLIPGPQYHPPTPEDEARAFEEAARMAEEFWVLVQKLEQAPLLWEGDYA